MKKTFYSNGKLLITGEYLVLDGAIALALPTKFGQNLILEEGNNNTIEWQSYDADGSIWFEDTITFLSIIKKERFDEIHNVKNTLIEILHEAYLLNPNFITQSNGYKISTELTFPKSWGLGTSSTLINNIAQWLQVDGFELLRKSFGGSGYDIACAQNNSAILYQLVAEKPVVKSILFDLYFSRKIYFVYLNKKQNTTIAIASYYNKKSAVSLTIPTINAITEKLITTDSVVVFAETLKKHETEMSAVLELPTVQELLFSDFDGTIKSLGAWGGDFVMVVSQFDPTNYFINKGYLTVIRYEDMIL